VNEAGLPPQRAESSAPAAANRDVVAVLDHAFERQLRVVADIAGDSADAQAALTAIVARHAEFARDKRDVLATWRQEFRNLPSEDAWRLRRMQRLYIEEWAQVVAAVRPDLSDAEARAAVHAALAVLHSVTEHQTGLSTESLTQLLASMAIAAVRGGSSAPGPPTERHDTEEVMRW